MKFVSEICVLRQYNFFFFFPPKSSVKIVARMVTMDLFDDCLILAVRVTNHIERSEQNLGENSGEVCLFCTIFPFSISNFST